LITRAQRSNSARTNFAASAGVPVATSSST